MRFYFAGLIHQSYRATLDSFIQALNTFRSAHPEVNVSFTFRGGLFDGRHASLPVRILPWASEGEIASDLDDADVLYLPLPFDSRYEGFYRFSLSTKMVTYLGSGLPILYHGPADSAAGRMLGQHQAAILVNTLDPQAIMRALRRAQCETSEIVSNALRLARAQFMLEDQADKFWHMLGARQPVATT
jgi:hypothetical protein